MSSRRTPSPQPGFTLLEALAVLLIMTVLAAMAAPATQALIANQRLKSAAGELFSAIVRTRSEAIKRNVDVSLAPHGSWNQGWVVENPAGGNLENHGALTNVTVTGPATLTYSAEGRVRGAGNPRFHLSVAGGTARCILIDLSGRPKLNNVGC